MEKKPFLAIKNSIFQSPKNRIFPKGLTHAFGQKMQTKNNERSILIFQLKPWVNSFYLEKSLIWLLCKIDIFRVWKAFPSIQNIIKQCFQLYFDQKQRKTKFQFFDLNLRLTPLEKSLIWRLCEMDILLSLESLSFYLEHQQTIFLGLF